MGVDYEEPFEPTGWSWITVFSSLMVQLITCGLCYSAGIYQLTFLDEFDQSHFRTSWIGSLLLGCTAFGGIIGVYVSRNLSCRTSVMVGGFVSALGFGISRLIWAHWLLYLSIGVVGGLGLGMAFSPSIMAVEQHFRHAERSFALGLAVWGIGMGIAVFPPCLHLLIELLHWKGAILILSGIALNIMLCGVLMRPPPGGKKNFVPFPLFHAPLLGNFNFLILMLSNLLWSCSASIIYTYLPMFAWEHLSEHLSGPPAEETQLEAALLVSIIGISLFVCRTLFRLLQISDIFVNLLCSVGISLILTFIWPQLFEHYSGMIAYCLLFGIFAGFWPTFSAHTTKELIGREYASMGNGWLALSIGVGCIGGAPLAGWLYDETNNFDYVFYTAGGCMLCCSCFMIGAKLIGCQITAPPYGYVGVDRRMVSGSTSQSTSYSSVSRDRSEKEEKDPRVCVELMLTSV